MPAPRLTAAACLAACLALAPGAAQADHVRRHFTPGAAGIGDPYWPLDGNGGFDVRSYDLDLSYDPATDVLAGTASLIVETTQDLSRFDLDLVGLDVSSVSVDRRPATWVRDGQELVITPARGMKDHDRFLVQVAYSGVPETIDDEFGLSGFFHTDDGALVVGEPHVAATWFPCSDHPSDKASFALTLTAPSGLQVLSNGVLTGQESDAGQTAWSWRESEPMAPYLAMMAVGHFDVRSYRADGVQFWDAVDPSLPAQVQSSAWGTFARQPEALAAMSDVFGPYPFTGAGGIVDSEPRYTFALENQSRPTYASGVFRAPGSGDDTVVHELAHQWYGDSVSVERWRDIWLNEGFATYTEWLASEYQGGPSARELALQLYDAIPATSSFWRLDVADPGAAHIFDAPVYDRGALALAALREQVGDDDFFEVLRRWATERAGGNGSTSDFVALAEDVSGQELSRSFRTWLSAPAKPALLGQPAGAGATATSASTSGAGPAGVGPAAVGRR